MSKEKKGRHFTRSASARISFSFDAILIRGPIKFLNDTLKEKRYLEGVIVSAMYLERYGVDKLKEYFKSKGIPTKPFKFDNEKGPNLWQIIDWLGGFGIIKPHIKGWMDDVRDERNRIVHKLRHPDEIDVKKTKNTIEKAKKCLSAIGVT